MRPQHTQPGAKRMKHGGCREGKGPISPGMTQDGCLLTIDEDIFFLLMCSRRDLTILGKLLNIKESGFKYQ